MGEKHSEWGLAEFQITKDDNQTKIIAVYQVMPDLTAEDFAALKADIDTRGVLVPVEYDEDGNILDGHHRVRACEELGITEWPRFVRKGLSEAEKQQHARQLNLARRHMSRDQREELWADLRHEGMSYRQIAEADGTVSHVTVASTVKNLTVDQPETITGKDGKKRAARKPMTTEFRDPSPETTAGVPRKTFVANNSGKNEWYTPKHFIDAARAVLGGIDLDPASSDIANETVQAAQFFTEENDGLTQRWPEGRIWMNPPYAQPLMAQFAEKYSIHMLRGIQRGTRSGVVLVNNATETGWFHQIASVSSAICFPKGRIRFVDTDGIAGGAPLQGQAILYSGNSSDVFLAAFSEFGVVFSNG